MESSLRNHIKKLLDTRLLEIETKLNADVISYTGGIRTDCLKQYRDFIEDLAGDPGRRKKLVIILKTPGGSAEAAEKIVDINRNFYPEVDFIVPDFAMSAGTILCMSGDKIYMDYSSSLGPIDPQVLDKGEKGFIPALGYLDKIEELIAKARDGSITEAEMIILKDQDLGMLNFYEQAKSLSISLLEKWLVEYKFKDWTIHRTNNPGTPVTGEQKKERAKKIAELLSNNKIWHSHGRFINMNTLRGVVGLEIEDFGADADLQLKIRDYNDTLSGMVGGSTLILHSRKFF